MKRIYKVTVGSSSEIAENVYHVVQDNLCKAAYAGLAAYKKDARRGGGLTGNVRVMKVTEVGRLS